MKSGQAKSLSRIASEDNTDVECRYVAYCSLLLSAH